MGGNAGGCRGIWELVLEGCRGEVQWEMPVGVVQRWGMPGGCRGGYRRDAKGSLLGDAGQ